MIRHSGDLAPVGGLLLQLSWAECQIARPPRTLRARVRAKPLRVGDLAIRAGHYSSWGGGLLGGLTSSGYLARSQPMRRVMPLDSALPRANRGGQLSRRLR